MSTFRPSINPDDGYFNKIIKYIPAEIVAAYTACIGIIGTIEKCEGDVHLMPWIFYGLLIFTPIYMYIAVIDNPAIADPDKKKKQAFFHAVISLLAYIVWTYALADDPLKCIFKRIEFNPKAGSLLLIGFSLITPLLERLFLGKPKNSINVSTST